MNTPSDRADPVARDVDPADPVEVGRRERERLVGEDVGHRRPLEERDVAQPRRERRAVEQVAGVEEEREHDDRQPRQPGRDVAHGGELGRAGEGDDAHRARLEQRVAGVTRRQPEHEGEADRGGRDARGIEDGAACGRPAGRSLDPRLPEERLRAGPVADDVDGVQLCRVAGGVEQARAAGGRALPDPPAVLRVERASTRPPACRRGPRARRRAPRRAPRAPPRSRSCTGSSGRRSRSRAPPRCETSAGSRSV